LALHLTSLVLDPPDAVMRSSVPAAEPAWLAFSFTQIHLTLGAGLILAAAGLLARRLGGLVVATLGVVLVGVAMWAWYRNPLAAQLARLGADRDILAADQLAPFYGAGALGGVALLLCGVLLVWVALVWVGLLRSAG
jgi:hypothetical protein